MLSSTIKTLIGGTDPSNIADNDKLELLAPFVGVGFLFLRDLVPRWGSRGTGVGGGLPLPVGGASGAGGVGSGGATGIPGGLSEAFESCRGRWPAPRRCCVVLGPGEFTTTLAAELVAWATTVGDEVC